MIDHISLRVSDYLRSKAFYEKALATLGYTLVFSNDQEQYAGFAGPDRERIWIGRNDGPRGYAHVAILSTDRATVRRFYDEAIKAGGRDNGGPARDRNTVRPTTARSCWTRTGTISRRSASPRANNPAGKAKTV